MSAESHKDFSNTTNPEQNENSKLSPSHSEKIFPKTEEKLILPLNHIEEKDNNQTQSRPKKKKHRSKKIIIIETPAPEPKKAMKEIHVRYRKQPKKVIEKIQPEMPNAHGPKTISLIRNPPKYRPVILTQPQPLILTQVAVPLIRVPIYGQNIRMPHSNQLNRNFQKIAPNQTGNFAQNFNHNQPGQPRFFGPGALHGKTGQMMNPNQGFIQPRNGQMINKGPGPGYNHFNAFNNLNGPNRKNEYGQQIVKNNSDQNETDRAGPSPILLFHDKEDDDNQIKKENNAKSNNGESLKDESDATMTSRHGAKSKFGRNKLDFISNLFDGYYYTNIDYEQDNSLIDNNLVGKIEPLEKSSDKELNYPNSSYVNQSSARFSNSFTNSSGFPPINQKAEFSDPRESVKPIRKFASGEIYPHMDRMSQSGNYHSVDKLPSISSRSKNEDITETRIKSTSKTVTSKKSNETDQKRLNYPRNPVLANN